MGVCGAPLLETLALFHKLIACVKHRTGLAQQDFEWGLKHTCEPARGKGGGESRGHTPQEHLDLNHARILREMKVLRYKCSALKTYCNVKNITVQEY